MKIELSPRPFWALTLGWLTAGISFYAGARVGAAGLYFALGFVPGAVVGAVLGPALERLRRQ